MVRRFHHSMPLYRPTPLVPLKQLAHRLGLGFIWVKDESQRLGLKAFKGLGASYAVCATLAQRFNMPGPLKFDAFRKPHIQTLLPDITLVAASDGNHGAAVAWMANQLGSRSLVFLPDGTADVRVRAIEELGGKAVVADGNYDHAVRQAAREADQKNKILIQDTAWEGYETVPQYVMQGYLTLLDEALEQVDGVLPTHILVPCGVGAFAAALQAYLVEKFAGIRPILIAIEAAAADCYFRSMVAGGQKIIPVTGDLKTRMAGLACGEPTRPGWKILRQYADGFVS